MVPKLLKSGQSFKGLSDYLSHDSDKAQTSKRVAWTHTINCSHDHVPSAVHEMYTTQLDAEALKREAGVHAGGRPVEKPVKHISLNWHRDDDPTKEHMIATTEDFLQRMGWGEHQAVVYCHTDRHPHVHVMINAVHPETGKTLDTSFERRRAQEWALDYEKQQDQIRCEQRLKDQAEREDSLTRDAWQAMKEGEQQHQQAESERRTWDADYMGRVDNREVRETEEWKLLKTRQREEREAFFAEGKKAYGELRASVYRDVREEFRNEWAGYYALAREGVAPDYLTQMKEDILERQQTVLQEQRDAACADLRHDRDLLYSEILHHQQEARHDLHDRQEQGLSTPGLLDLVNGGPPREPESIDLDAEFGAAAEEVTRDENAQPFTFGGATIQDGRSDVVEREGGSESSRDIGADTASAGIAAFAGVGEKLFDGFFGSGPPKKDKPATKDPNPFARSAEKAMHKAMEDEQKKKDRDYWDDRDRSRD